jgi:hypothetical protein
VGGGDDRAAHQIIFRTITITNITPEARACEANN